VVVKTREYGSPQSYKDFLPKEAEKDIEKLWE
jgi:hypothetical protein